MTCAAVDPERCEEALAGAPVAPIDDEGVFIGKIAPAPPRALIVDGDPAVAQSLALMFADQGFTIETALLGADGVRLAADRPYALIILGVDLPDMSGLEAMSRLRKANVSATVVFASMTAPSMLHLSNGA